MAFRVRDVRHEDSNFLLEWRNALDVRVNAVNQSLIPVKDHEEWLNSRLLQLRSEPFWVFENEIQVIGIVRFDKIFTQNKYEVSILINPSLRGQGHGQTILKEALTKFYSAYQIARVTARVHKQNIASMRLFLGSGFIPFEDQGDFECLELIRNFDQSS